MRRSESTLSASRLVGQQNAWDRLGQVNKAQGTGDNCSRCLQKMDSWLYLFLGGHFGKIVRVPVLDGPKGREEVKPLS